MSPNKLPLKLIERIFMRLHGRFGNAFLDKYRIGELNTEGKDIGVENAKNVWAEELAGMTNERIKAALDSSYEYPPSCDDFKMNCRIKPVISDYKALPKVTDREAAAKQVEKLRVMVADMAKSKRVFNTKSAEKE